MTSDLTLTSATKLARLIRTRAVSPVEVMEAYLGRIEELNPRLNAIVTLAPDLLERARAAEAAVMKGAAKGALHGVPLTVKDTIETIGLRTTSGSRVRAGYIPQRDAPAVARLKAAGAILLGKTNVSELALDYESDNPLFGPSLNPHDHSRTPGGSSGGEAAAISARLSAAGLGSDLSGSIRIPAHFCGIVGLKPTAGSVPGPGQFPPAVGPYSLGSTIGPMARRVEDLSLVFSVIAGVRAHEELVSSPNRSEARQTLRGLRLAWYTDDQVSPVTESTRAAVQSAVGALEAAGLLASKQLPPGIERGPSLWMALFSRAILEPLQATYSGREMEAGELARFLLKSFADKPAPSMDELLSAWMERDRLRGALIEWMKDVPLIVAPVGATHAFEHGARRLLVSGQSVSVFRAFSYSQTFNVYGLPSVCVPAGRAREDGLPVGVQIVGRPFEEELVLAAAAVVEEALGGWQPPPAPPLALSPEG
ncbi:MAG TPA: amidase [Pyrinomonadaceae bacterium]|nr:amidase [Pyrinomonadaceae bacterium]